MNSQSDFFDEKPSKRLKIENSTSGCDSTVISMQKTGNFSEPKHEGVNFNTNQSVPIPLISPNNDTNDTFALGSQESLSDDNDSEVSSVSNLSVHDSKQELSWLQEQIRNGIQPRALLQNYLNEEVPEYLDEDALWKLLISIVSQSPQREKLSHINTVDDVVDLIKMSQKIVVLTGAGVSVSSGIPDFRSKDGIYSRLATDFPDLPNPQAMFDIQYFTRDPRPFFQFAKDIYPGKFEPSPCHRFIKLLETNGKLLRNYTQNIDTLERIVGIKKLVECHGSFATASCTQCNYRSNGDQIQNDIFEQKIPMCPQCQAKRESNSDTTNANNEIHNLFSLGVMKPDIVFFGEALPESFHETMSRDKFKCDLLIVIGSSLKVRPVALIPNSLPPHVPQILINREPLPHLNFDVELLGECDIILNQLCQLLGEGWGSCVWREGLLKQTSELLLPNLTNTCEPMNTNQPVIEDLNPQPSSSSTISALNQTQSLQIPSMLSGSLGDYLLPNTYNFQPPSRYIFQGAEVSLYPDPSDDLLSVNYSSDSDSSDSDIENDLSEIVSNAGLQEKGLDQQSQQSLLQDTDGIVLPTDNVDEQLLNNAESLLSSDNSIISNYLTQEMIEQYLNQDQLRPENEST